MKIPKHILNELIIVVVIIVVMIIVLILVSQYEDDSMSFKKNIHFENKVISTGVGNYKEYLELDERKVIDEVDVTKGFYYNCTDEDKGYFETEKLGEIKLVYAKTDENGDIRLDYNGDLDNITYYLPDRCYLQGKLVERYCTKDNLPAYKIVECSTMCVNGACTKIHYTSCEDNETKVKKEVKGKVKYSFSFKNSILDLTEIRKRDITDSCKNDSILIETSCRAKRPYAEEVTCKGYCEDGRCIEE